MLSKASVSLLMLGGQASATYLYVSSYTGVITTLNLTDSTLTEVATNDGCGSSPSWLTLSSPEGVLYCNDEGFATWPTGHLATFATNEDGSLELLGSAETFVGGVSNLPYGPEGTGLAVAYYAGSAFATWDVSDPTAPSLVQEEVLELSEPGADPDRQEAPHPHQVLADPTGEFILVPDLGADLVRIYAVGEGLSTTAVEPLSVTPGSGPRHAAFAVHGETTYFYLVNELANTIFGYTVSYGEGSISFEQIYESGTHGEGVDVPEGASAAEIVVSNDQNFLIVSSRNENAFEIPNFDSNNSTQIVSDTLINFSIDAATGGLTATQEVPAGGRFPRQFSLNEDNTLLAVGLQSDGRVAVIARDAETGELGEFVASAPVEGEVTAVIFNELI